MRLLVTRPEADAVSVASLLRGLGHEVTTDPVLEVLPSEGPAPTLDGRAVLIFTSANGVRAWASKSSYRGTTAYAVGRHTAEAARQAGFAHVESAEGDIDALTDLLIRKALPAGTTCLHVRGEHAVGDLASRLSAAGYQSEEYIAYTARSVRRLASAAALQAGELDGVLLFSARTARHFTLLVKEDQLTQALGRMTAFCLSAAIAKCASEARFGRIETALEPTQAALLALLPTMKMMEGQSL